MKISKELDVLTFLLRQRVIWHYLKSTLDSREKILDLKRKSTMLKINSGALQGSNGKRQVVNIDQGNVAQLQLSANDKNGRPKKSLKRPDIQSMIFSSDNET